mmetsp:Transcript_49535/g.117923  ORF Transcript_49535/g.117923 Transcript_49535/m.117923 type:complete len:154 (-) Transcript_49535:69-530(-)
METKRAMNESGLNYFKGSKVGSARGYMTTAGMVLAIPHSARSKSAQSPRIRFDAVSEQASQFTQLPNCYASMDNKPLSPYHPLAYRSRLALDDVPVPYKNSSSLEFNGGMDVVHKKRFLTTHKLSYTGEQPDPRSNQGILSEQTKLRRQREAQ